MIFDVWLVQVLPDTGKRIWGVADNTGGTHEGSSILLVVVRAWHLSHAFFFAPRALGTTSP